MSFLIRFTICIASLGIMLYSYIEKHNNLTEMRIKVPILQKKLTTILNENTHLQFEIEKFENPLNLMEISRKPQYGHLKHPFVSDIICITINKTENESETWKK
jgi:hypothetical protein